MFPTMHIPPLPKIAKGTIPPLLKSYQHELKPVKRHFLSATKWIQIKLIFSPSTELKDNIRVPQTWKEENQAFDDITGSPVTATIQSP